MLYFEDRQPFATGSTTYTYQPISENETTPRILLKVSFEGIITTAAVDTGSPLVILNPQIAEALQLNLSAGILKKDVWLRRDKLDGYLHRLSLDFTAEEGQPLTVEATVFVPELEPYQERGDFPSIIGLNTCLERLRFAIDPSQDKFYFGALS